MIATLRDLSVRSAKNMEVIVNVSRTSLVDSVTNVHPVPTDSHRMDVKLAIATAWDRKITNVIL